jgi:hypothetical protein
VWQERSFGLNTEFIPWLHAVAIDGELKGWDEVSTEGSENQISELLGAEDFWTDSREFEGPCKLIGPLWRWQGEETESQLL